MFLFSKITRHINGKKENSVIAWGRDVTTRSLCHWVLRHTTNSSA